MSSIRSSIGSNSIGSSVMLRALRVAAALAALLPVLALAQNAGPDFSADSQAKSWGLSGEQKARFQAKVVDVLCELTGDCPADCGAGRRQLGLLRAADGALVPAAKNGETVFSGAVADLLPYCAADVEVDGLMVGEGPTKIYQVQLVRRVGEAEWSKTNRFTAEWNAAHPDLAGGSEPWFRKDPRVTSRIAAEGYLGLGLETDAAFIKEEFGQ